MKIRAMVVLALLLGLVLNACIPAAQAGTDASVPLRFDDDPVSVKAGSTTFVSVLHRGTALGLTTSDLNRLFNNTSPVKGQINRATLGGIFGTTSTIPDGWTIELNRSTAYREITDVDATTFTFIQGVELVFAVKVPPTARGNQVARMGIARATSAIVIPLALRVDAPANATLPASTQ